jgi:hypothetical protein
VNLSDLGDAAVTYAGGWEWAVFPLRPDDKRPATERGFHDATTDSARVVDEWARQPNANVGIATGAVSGLVVIDVDPGGDETIEALKRTLGPLPPTLVALTPRGAHAYFRHPGVEVRCSAGRLGPGVDVRADGGYVVAPPSRIYAAEYRWRLPAGQVEPLPSDLADLPPSWVEVMRSQPISRVSGEGSDRNVAAAYRDEVRSVESAAQGLRNETLNRAAFALGRFTEAGRLREEEVVDRLLLAAATAGLSEDEARRTIRSALDARKRG